MKKSVLAASMLFALSGCSDHKVPDIRQAAPEQFKRLGFELVAEQGYIYGGPGPRWGGCVWYLVKKVPDNGILYEGCLAKWGNSYELWEIKAIDAITPKAK